MFSLCGEKLKVAVVGFGKMGMLHAGILNALPNVKLVGICEKSGLIRRFLEKAFRNVSVVDDVEELSDLGLDAVYVTTPISSHYSVVKSVYDVGVACNVFVEKTLASNFNEARDLCYSTQKFGGVNMVGYMRRFSVTFRKAKNLLEQGAVGRPVSFSTYAYSSDFFGINGNDKMRTPKVGVLRDLGCHAIDLALWFFGDINVTEAKVESKVHNGVEDSAHAEVLTSNGLRGEFNFSWCMAKYRMPEVGFSIEGSKGVINVSDDELELLLHDGRRYRWFRHDLHDEVAFWLGGPEYYREDEHFVKSVILNEAAEPSFKTSAEVDRVIDEIRAKAR